MNHRTNHYEDGIFRRDPRFHKQVTGESPARFSTLLGAVGLILYGCYLITFYRPSDEAGIAKFGVWVFFLAAIAVFILAWIPSPFLRRLRDQGRILPGVIVDCRGIRTRRGQVSIHRLTYRFTTPDGREYQHTHEVGTAVLVLDSFPDLGTPVEVVYVDDETIVLL
ncbi:MAG TPA: hypothetical protein PLD47_00025 [Aggregatilineales bacterium]|nr:hypothetical protein [Anaerolineales bacterium]HRE46084.1 hypothetical protein [Aggregatilineales bacterium]